MADASKIEWTDATFNPWIGCTKVSPGCDHCYAEAWDRRFAWCEDAMHWGAGKPRRRTSDSNWRLPLRWNAAHETFLAEHGRRRRVFCASLADVFDNEVPEQWRWDLFRVIAATPNLDWLLLTKRIGNARKMLNEAASAVDNDFVGADTWDRAPWPNVWVGASIVNQEEAGRDIPKLLATPAAVRFLSIEPMLGPVDLRRFVWPVHPRWPARYNTPADAIADGAEVTYHRQALLSAEAANRLVDWVIVGGESGPKARPMHPEWARSLRVQCAAAGVPFFFKQWGEWTPGENVGRRRGSVSGATWFNERWAVEDQNLAATDRHIDDEPDLYRVGKKDAGRLLNGRTWDEVPAKERA